MHLLTFRAHHLSTVLKVEDPNTEVERVTTIDGLGYKSIHFTYCEFGGQENIVCKLEFQNVGADYR